MLARRDSKSPRPAARGLARLRAFALVLPLACIFASPAPQTRAAESYQNSLDWVPADAAFYAASFHLKDQVDIVANSNAWKTFRQIPSVAMGWSLATAQINDPNGPAATFWQLMALPENKQLVQVAGEMVSDEIVIYGGESFTKLIELYQVVNGARYAQLAEAVQQLEGGALGGPESIGADGDAQMRAIVDAIKEDPALADVPELTFGFRIKDKAAAITQLARLEILANMGLEQTPLGAKFERRKVGDAEYIVLYLDGSMLPLTSQVPDELRDILTKKTLYLSIGVWNDYVLLSINKSTDHLAQIGAGDGIGTRKELATLADHKDQKLVGVNYASREFMASQVITAEDVEGFKSLLHDLLEGSSSIPDELKSRLAGDLDELTTDLTKYLPVAGAAAGYQFLTDTGYEGYRYSWADLATLDSTKPLELANHLGGSPLLAFAARGIEDPAAYDNLVKWIVRGYGYFNDFALPQMDEDEREQAKQVLAVLGPFAKRLDEANRTKLIPALADGQSGLLFDADITSKQWQKEMPESHAPLAMLEFGIVVGVSDAKLLVSAMSDYRQAINDAFDAIENMKLDDEMPKDLEFPAPEASEVSDGTVYVWKLSPAIGLDDQIVPCTAVGENVAVFATSRALAERVLADHPLAPAVPLLKDDDAPRASIGGINWAELMSSIEPWVVYAIRMNLADEATAAADPASDPPQVQEICEQAATVFNILRCYEGSWFELQKQDDAWVTHSVSQFHDLAE